ncbi:hypothetical protein M2156_005321 [Streptomyces sp. SAI-149]|nr:hypothetical protein [Streptomyces sp. SAI-149]
MPVRYTRRRSARSTHAPANRLTPTIGTACAMPTAPLQTVLWVMSQTWYMTVTMVMKVPSVDTVRPNSSRRKTGEVRSGRTSRNVRLRLMTRGAGTGRADAPRDGIRPSPPGPPD